MRMRRFIMVDSILVIIMVLKRVMLNIIILAKVFMAPNTTINQWLIMASIMTGNIMANIMVLNTILIINPWLIMISTMESDILLGINL